MVHALRRHSYFKLMHHCKFPTNLIRCIKTSTGSSRHSEIRRLWSSLVESESCSHLQVQNNAERIVYRNALFDSTKKEKLSKLVPRIEKVEVRYQGRGISDSAIMFMNKHISTPHHCAMHISKTVADHAVLALITPLDQETTVQPVGQSLNGNEIMSLESDTRQPAPVLWDLHRPIPCNCKLEILQFNMENSTVWKHEEVNKAYWHSCSMILGSVMQEAFKNNYKIGLSNLPHIPVNRGAFCYDVVFDNSLRGWDAKENDLIFLTKLARSIVSKNLKFERLEVSPECARDMFSDDQLMLYRISRILETAGDDANIILYRFGDYIDISNGPHISNTSQIYHYVVTAIHKLNAGDDLDLRRVQGLSLPKDLKVHHAIWSMLESRARKLVKDKTRRHDEDVMRGDDLLQNSIESKTKEYMKSTGQWMEGRWKDTTDSLNPVKTGS